MGRRCFPLRLYCSTVRAMKLVGVLYINRKVLLVQGLNVWCSCHQNALCGYETGQEIFINVISVCSLSLVKTKYSKIQVSTLTNEESVCLMP